MKKLSKILLLLVCVLSLTGCLKVHSTMTIKNDKSMVYESEFLVAESLNDSLGSIMNETEIKDYEKKGYKVEAVKGNNGYSGYKVSKEYKNIDDLAKNSGDEVEISEIFSDDFDNSKIFTVKKGFLKNKYTANFKFSSSDVTGDLNEDDLNFGQDIEGNAIDEESGASEKEEEVTTTSAEDVLTTGTEDENSTEAFEGLADLMTLAAEMEYTYTVNLPSAALSNNASSVENDGKTLKWNLSTEGDSEINFEFELYNMTNIYIICGAVVALIAIIVVVIIVISKNKKKKEDNFTPTVVNDTPEGETPIMGTTNEEVVDSIETVAETPAESTFEGPVATETPVEEAPATPTEDVPMAPAEPTPVEPEPVPAMPAELEPVSQSDTLEPPVMAPEAQEQPLNPPTDTIN